MQKTNQEKYNVMSAEHHLLGTATYPYHQFLKITYLSLDKLSS